MLRHTALFMWRDTTDDNQKLVAKKGLAYLNYGCPSVRAVDFGSDPFGGSAPLLEIKPWDRTPLWHARPSGPPSDFDMALHLDFDDQAGLDAYNHDDVHHEVGVYNASIAEESAPLVSTGGTTDRPASKKGASSLLPVPLGRRRSRSSQKSDVRAAFLAVEGATPGCGSVMVGDNVGTLTTDYDLIVDVHFADLTDASTAWSTPPISEALALVAASTKYEWTARITHTMHAG